MSRDDQSIRYVPPQSKMVVGSMMNYPVLTDRFQAVRVLLDPLGLIQLERQLSPHEQRLYDELCEEVDLIEWEACQCASEA